MRVTKSWMACPGGTMLQNAFGDVLKSIGEGLAATARKGQANTGAARTATLPWQEFQSLNAGRPQKGRAKLGRSRWERPRPSERL
jgi:hypothetical protein